MSKPEQNEAEGLDVKKEGEVIKDLQAAPELKKYRLGQRVISKLVGFASIGVAVAKTVGYVLIGNSTKAVESAADVAAKFSGTVDPDLNSKNQQKISITRGVLRSVNQLALAGLSTTSAVFKILAGDLSGAVTDGLVVFDSGLKAVTTIASLIPKGEPKPPGRVSKFFSGIFERSKSVGNAVLNKVENYKAGRFAVRLSKAIYKAATSPQAKVIAQVAGAAFTLATAATPLGIVIASLALGAVVCKGIRSYENARSLRKLKEKHKALLNIEKQQNKRAEILSKNPDLHKLLEKGGVLDSFELLEGKKKLGPLPKMREVNLANEAVKAGAYSALGGSAAILRALAKDPLSQAATGIALFGGVVREADSGVKEQLSRSALKRKIWELGGDKDSLIGVEEKLLDQQRCTLALKLLEKEIKNEEIVRGSEGERFSQILKNVSAKNYPTPTFGDRVRSAFRGFGRDCNSMFFDNIKEGWKELKGEKVEDKPIVVASSLDKAEARYISHDKEEAVTAPDLTIAKATENINQAKESPVNTMSDVHTFSARASAYEVTENSNGKITKKEDKRKSPTEVRKTKEAKKVVAPSDVNLTLVKATVIGASAKGHVTDPAPPVEIDNATVIGASTKGHVISSTSSKEVTTKVVTAPTPSTGVLTDKAKHKGVS